MTTNVEFEQGTQIRLADGRLVTVQEKLGEGGQAVVYRVTLDGTAYALKWYFSEKLHNKQAFIENLTKNIKDGAPNDAFIWPLVMTDTSETESFGYIMNLLPNDYFKFSDFLLNKVNRKVGQKSISITISAALNIVNSFRDLHRKGKSYQDLNDGNFSIDPKTGNVLFVDCDNVAPYGMSLGVAGKARYMAPEIVRNKERPNDLSDRFSMAVVLFFWLFGGHPLEGKRVVKAPCLTEELELKFFGQEPIFVYDPDCDENRPVPGMHDNVIRLWRLYPEFVREAFMSSFCKDSFENPDRRIIDNAWQKIFTNLQSNLIVCPHCNEETFVYDGGGKCVNCNTLIPSLPHLECKDGKYRVTIFPGNKLYQCHVESDSDDYRQVCGEVIRNPKNPQVWGIRNLTQNTWQLTNKDGTTSEVPSQGVLNVMRVHKIAFSPDCEGEIIFG